MKTLARSFAGGEIAPEMFGRLDLGKFQTGLQLALNFTTLPHGPAARRPGFYYLNEVKDSTQVARLIPFVFNATQAVWIELGNLTARFHDTTGTVLEASKAIVSIVGNVVTVNAHGWATGDDVFLLGASGGRFLRATVTGANTFTTADLWGTATSPSTAYTTAARVYTLATPWAAADLMALNYAQSADVLTITSTAYATRELRRAAAASWSVATVSFTPTLAAPAGVTCVATKPTPTNPIAQSYVVTSIAADNVTESVASTAASDTNNLSIFGNFNTIAWSAAAGAARYHVYKLRGGAYGYIGQTTALTLIDDNILADPLSTPPAVFTSLNTAAGDYPGAVTYFEQRRWFAGTASAPQNVWGTRSSTDANLTSSIPSGDADALTFRIAAQQQNAIRHLLPLTDLMALTVGGEFRIFAEGGPAITPGTLAVKPQAFSGAAAVQPALASNSALYVQSQGSRVRELTPPSSGFFGLYTTVDVSLFAPHLFNGYQVTQLAYRRAPDQTLWAVRNDGALLGLTHIPEQQVYGWHHHTTAGLIESCASIPVASEDVLGVIVKRTVNGRSVRYVEWLKSRLFTAAADAFFVDAGLTYSGAPTTTVSGLWHLEGQAVSVLADAGVVSGCSVLAGALTPVLETAASKIHIGLAYNSDMQTLPATFDQTAASGQGTMKNVSIVNLRVTQSSLVKAGPSFAKLTEYPARAVSDPYGSPPALRTGELRLAISPGWGTDGAVCIRQDQPLPLTVLSLTLDDAVGG